MADVASDAPQLSPALQTAAAADDASAQHQVDVVGDTGASPSAGSADSVAQAPQTHSVEETRSQADRAPVHAPGAAQGSFAPPVALGTNGVSQRAFQAVQQVKGLVQQALNQQQSHTMAAQAQLQKHVQGLNQLLERQSSGLAQTETQIEEIEQSVTPSEAKKQAVSSAFSKLRHTHAKITQLHGILQQQLANLQESQAKEQDKRLGQAKSHVGGLFNMLQDQTLQLDKSQQQVEALTRFAHQARFQVQMIATSHEATMKKTNAHVKELQDKLEEQRVVQTDLVKQLNLQKHRKKGSSDKVQWLESKLTHGDFFAKMRIRRSVEDIGPEEARTQVVSLMSELAELMSFDNAEEEEGYHSDESC